MKLKRKEEQKWENSKTDKNEDKKAVRFPVSGHLTDQEVVTPTSNLK